ncbi:S8/S53 family peptidase [Pontibacter cellulosilyticus]|uniref:S8 family peptidase n=1 Tax=Pontibacter cellulosilyticus TaxID=1720253 RepID=A0A923N563_9BACT|nr:S8/S53 family peptidase [Pontibacter cellulosilyticus]MBC5992436.1 S8 family peptidase [Pontibacter cellulosilyticus]
MKNILAVAAICMLWANTVFAQAFIDPKLKDAIADRTKLVQVVVTFKSDGAPTLLDKSLLTQVGILQGLTLKALPIAGVLATAPQVEELAKSSRVLSLYLNESLKYENNTGTAITGVNKVRNEMAFTTLNGGMPVSGKGIGVLVNDSGVDGTHPDLQFGKNLKQNVTAATNLNSVSGILPYTPIENVPNTDATGGHGTHVAGIVGGTGQASTGKYTGVAPGADLVGYGSGAALLLLDVLSGFDYALINQAQYNIRVITNSFGTTSDTGTDVNPADPITLATKRCVDRNIVVVFSAGNSGPSSGTITGQYKKAPWVIAVAAGDKQGRLADFSSRGIEGKGGSFMLDGKTYTWQDRPTVTSPGVDIISTRVIAPVSSLSADKDATELEAAHVPYYTHMSGTSMAAPHVAGIVALLLDANPTLTVAQVKEILQQTATNIPNRESWEVGAGYVNAYAAVDRAFRATAPYGSTLNLTRTFNSNVNSNNVSEKFTIDFNPATTVTNNTTFNVASGTTSIEAKIKATGVAGETGNPVRLTLISPSGVRTSAGIPVTFTLSYDRGVAVASPEAGTWTVEISGLNGAAFPETINGTINMMTAAGMTGLNDIAGHPAEASIKMAVNARLADGLSGGNYRPDELLKRIDMADYLMMGEGIRQFLPIDGSFTLSDVKERNLLAESIVAKGAALRDVDHVYSGIMLPVAPGKFNPNGKVSRADIAYSLVQALGLQKFAVERNGKSPTVNVDGTTYPIEDAADIPAGLEGYVSVALEMNLINAYFTLTQGPYDLQPTLHANFKPNQDVTRGDFAVIITRTHAQWNAATQPIASSSTSAAIAAGELSTATEQVYSYPNPFTGVTTISYVVPQDGEVQVAIYDVLGKKLQTLVAESMKAGSYTTKFDGSNLPGGTYIYRVQAGSKVYSNRMILTK